MRNERKLQNILTKLCGKLCEGGSFKVISVTRSLIVFTIFSNILTYSFSVQASPGFTTYQAKIIKPDGYPLEATSVNFRFTVMDETASCILYTERYSAVNMQGTGGLISFSLGSGVKQYPVSATTFAEIFDNSKPSLSCDDGDPGSPDPLYVPQVNHTRKIVMQFQDAHGWQTLPAMSINAVPYAMYATETQKFGGVSAGAYVKYSTMPTCGASEALRYNGVSFSCISGGSLSSVSSGDIASALGYTPANQASVGASFTLATSYYNNLEASHTSLSNSVGVSFALATGYYNALAASHTLLSGDVSNLRLAVSGTQSDITSLQSSVGSLVTSMSAMTGSQWSTSGTTISYMNGNVGIGTSSTTRELHVVASSQSLVPMAERSSTGTAAAFSTFDIMSSTSADMVDGFGPANRFLIKDSANVENPIAHIAGVRDGADNSGALLFSTYASGSALVKMTVKSSGNIGIGTTTPSAKLHIISGTSSLAPLKFTSGTLLASPASGSVEYDGFNLYFTDGSNQRRTIATTSGSGSFDGTSSISNSAGNITLAPNNTTGSVVVSSTTNSSNSNTGALVVKGGVGISGDTYIGGNLNVLSTIIGTSFTATNGMISSYIAGSVVSGGSLALDSTNHANKGNIALAPNGGTVGVGLSNPNSNVKLQVSGTAVAGVNIISSGNSVNLSLGNTHLLKNVGNTNIILQNGVSGGAYTLIVSDTTARQYTFSGCTNTYFTPANTTTSGRSSFSILMIVDGANTECYIAWLTDFQQ